MYRCICTLCGSCRGGLVIFDCKDIFSYSHHSPMLFIEKSGTIFEIGLPQSHRFRRRVKVAGSGGLCYTCVMGTWKSKNRHKYLLQYHIIFVCKYRKKLLMSKQISDDIKQFSYEICQKHKVIIRYMETDKDHIHYMIETEPTMSISKIVNLMKSYTTYHILSAV